MPQQVVAGAQLTCSFGTTPSALNVLPVNRLQCNKAFAANIQDHRPMVNIAPFGMCITPTNPMVASATAAALGVLAPQPCLPVTVTPWAPGAVTLHIAGQPALDNISSCNCMWGGIVMVTFPGQVTTSIP
jgi:hypothetical protein